MQCRTSTNCRIAQDISSMHFNIFQHVSGKYLSLICHKVSAQYLEDTFKYILISSNGWWKTPLDIYIVHMDQGYAQPSGSNSICHKSNDTNCPAQTHIVTHGVPHRPGGDYCVILGGHNDTLWCISFTWGHPVGKMHWAWWRWQKNLKNGWPCVLLALVEGMHGTKYIALWYYCNYEFSK